MNNPLLNGRRVAVVGERLEAVAREALVGARVERAEPDALRQADLVLIDAESSAERALALVEDFAARPAAPAVLLVGARLPMGLVRALFRLERSDVVETPFGPADLALAAGALLAGVGPTPASPPPPQDSRCWAFIGAVGGAGATTLAVEAAAVLAKRSKGRRKICLVDLNLADGAAAAYLGATANMRLSEASATPERIDAAMLGAFVARADEFDLLAAPRDPRAFQATSAETVVRLLDVACQVYDWVIVDTPRQRQAWTLDVLDGADETVVVSELTVPALLAARAMAAELEADLADRPPPRVVLNRLSKRMLGPAPSVAEAERALGRKADGAITSDWEAASASVNLGGPICQHRPRSRMVRDVGDLIDRLTAGQGSRPLADTKAA